MICELSSVACRESTGTDRLSLGPVSLTDPKTAHCQRAGWKSHELGEGGPKTMRQFLFNEVLGLVLQEMFSSAAFLQVVLEILCILNENWGCPISFPYKVLGWEVSPADTCNQQENLGGFFLSSKAQWAPGKQQELSWGTGARYRAATQRNWIYLRDTKCIQFLPHPRAQGPLISLAVLFLLSSDSASSSSLNGELVWAQGKQNKLNPTIRQIYSW